MSGLALRNPGSASSNTRHTRNAILSQKADFPPMTNGQLTKAKDLAKNTLEHIRAGRAQAANHPPSTLPNRMPISRQPGTGPSFTLPIGSTRLDPSGFSNPSHLQAHASVRSIAPVPYQGFRQPGFEIHPPGEVSNLQQGYPWAIGAHRLDLQPNAPPSTPLPSAQDPRRYQKRSVARYTVRRRSTPSLNLHPRSNTKLSPRNPVKEASRPSNSPAPSSSPPPSPPRLPVQRILFQTLSPPTAGSPRSGPLNPSSSLSSAASSEPQVVPRLSRSPADASPPIAPSNSGHAYSIPVHIAPTKLGSPTSSFSSFAASKRKAKSAPALDRYDEQPLTTPKKLSAENIPSLAHSPQTTPADLPHTRAALSSGSATPNSPFVAPPSNPKTPVLPTSPPPIGSSPLQAATPLSIAAVAAAAAAGPPIGGSPYLVNSWSGHTPVTANSGTLLPPTAQSRDAVQDGAGTSQGGGGRRVAGSTSWSSSGRLDRSRQTPPGNTETEVSSSGAIGPKKNDGESSQGSI